MKKSIKWIAVIIIFILVTVLAVIDRIETWAADYLRGLLPSTPGVQIDFDSVSIRFLQGEVAVEGMKILNGENKEISAERIWVPVSWRRIYHRDFNFEKLVIENPEVLIYRQKDGKTNIEKIVESLASPVGEDRPTPIRFERIEWRSGRIRYGSSAVGKDIVVLSPVEGTIGPIDLSGKTREVRFQGVMGLGNESGRIELEIEGDPSKEAEGRLRVEDVSVDFLGRILEGARVKEGTISGEVPFRFARGKGYPTRLDLKVTGTKVELSDRSSGKGTRSGVIWPRGLELPPVVLKLDRLRVLQGRREVEVKQGVIRTAAIREGIPDAEFVAEIELGKPAGKIHGEGKISVEKGNISSRMLTTCFLKSLPEINPILGDSLPFRFDSGNLETVVEGLLSYEALDLNVRTIFSGLAISGRRNVQSRLVFGVPVPALIKYLSSNEGRLDLKFRVTGSVSNPNYDVSKVLKKLLGRALLDAAMMYGVGLPAVVGDKAVEKVTGKSILKESKKAIKNILLDELTGTKK